MPEFKLDQNTFLSVFRFLFVLGAVAGLLTGLLVSGLIIYFF